MIIGLSGRNGAGKGEVLAFLESRSFYAHSLSDVIRDELRRRGQDETRERMIELLKNVPQQAQVTVLHVTHSRHEADLLGDLIFRLHEGRIEVIKAETPTTNIVASRAP